MFQPDFTSVEINKGIPFTDIMSAQLCGRFVINEKVKQILEIFHIPQKHKFYPIELIGFDNRVHGYYWFHLLEPSIEIEDMDIDYSNSEFGCVIGIDYKLFKAFSV